MERMKNLSERLRRVGMLQEADFFFERHAACYTPSSPKQGSLNYTPEKKLT